MRSGLVCLAAVLASTPASGQQLKPKFGDIEGIYYTEVSGEREACRQAINNKIALCRQNVGFESNTKDRKYPGCLPLFERQAEVCAAHFRRQESKCNLSGSVRITDFTGFVCEVTKTGVEDGRDEKGAPEVVSVDRRMRVRTPANLRDGPGTQHDKVGLLEAGREVRVTGQVGDWLRIEDPQGGEAFVHGSLLVDADRQEPAPKVALTPTCAGLQKGAKCWKETADKRGCHVWDTHLRVNQSVTWSGTCSGGVASGWGTLVWTMDGKRTEETGALAQGKKQGKWAVRYASGTIMEGPFVDGKHNGRWIIRYANGSVHEGEAVDGKKQGRWVIRLDDGTVWKGPYVDGRMNGRWVGRFPSGGVWEGPYVDGKKHGHWVERGNNGFRSEGPYVDGKRHGQWVSRIPAQGSVFEGAYVDGKEQGVWIKRFDNGNIQEIPYVDGEVHGRWINRYGRGGCDTQLYNHGKYQGTESGC